MMRQLRKGLAWMLVLLMLLSALPAGAYTDEDPWTADEVTFNLRDMEVTVGNNEELAASGELPYALFDGDGNYTIELNESDPLFPYEVQFTYQGRTFTEWFLDENDTVEVGSHIFRVACMNGQAVRIGAWVGDGYVPAYPEEKEFTNEYSVMPFSMLPLQEKSVTLDLTGFLPEELRAVSMDVITKKLPDISGTVAAWAKWGYWDEDGKYISIDDNYALLSADDKIDLSDYSVYSWQLCLELIIGTVDQFNPSNVRYRVYVDLSGYSDLFLFSAKDENKNKIDVYDGHLREHREVSYIYQVAVDKNDWKSGEKAYLQMSLASAFSGLTAEIYEGYYGTAEEIEEAQAADITAQVMGADGWLNDYSYQQNYQGMPEITAVVKRGGAVVKVLPMILYMYEDGLNLRSSAYDLCVDTPSGSRNWVTETYTRDYEKGYPYYTITLKDGYPASGIYYYNLRMDNPDPNATDGGICGINYVQKAVIGYFATSDEIPADAPDVKSQLFSDADSDTGGYGADYSEGVVFTIVDINGDLYWAGLKTVEYSGEPEESLNPLSRDTYFYVNSASGAPGDTQYNAWSMPYNADSYYDNGFQTLFLLTEDGGPVTDSAIAPIFYSGNKVNIYAGLDGKSGELQKSGETSIPFVSGTAIPYSAGAENGKHLKNYWVTFVTQESGARLFVNGTNDASHYDETENIPVREVFLTEDYDYHHDVFIANIGDAELTGLQVSLENAQNIALDDYWTVREGSVAKLAAFTTTEGIDSAGNYVTYGELPNVAKIRLVPGKDTDGNTLSGKISGKLVIKSANGGSVTIKLTGIAGIPQITTTDIVDGVKYVPYSSVIQTNNMYDPEAVSFSIVAGNLPAGVILKPNGELYGVPQAAGTWTFTVRAAYSGYESLFSEREFTLTIKDNTNINVLEATDTGYQLKKYIGTPVDDNSSDWEKYGPGTMLKPDYSQDVFWSSGSFAYFIDFWLDGKKLINGVDYLAEEGSTVITIYEETFEDAGSGTHTISAEFREGDPKNGTLKRTAQNYTIEQKPSRPSNPVITPPVAPSKPSTTTWPIDPDWPFVDVNETHWFFGDVKWAYEKKWMLGVSDTLFAPNDAITQATVATVLARMAAVDLSAYDGVYDSTIAPDKWYTNAAIWVRQAGLLPDYTSFANEGAFVRGQMAVMLVKYLRSLGIDLALPEDPTTFIDADLMSADVLEAFQVLYHCGIFKGVGEYRMDPNGVTTRAQFAALIHRASVFVESR